MLVSVLDSKVSSSIASFAPPLATPPPHPATLHYSIRDTGNTEHFAVLHSTGGRWYLDRTNGQPPAITQQSTDLHRNMFSFPAWKLWKLQSDTKIKQKTTYIVQSNMPILRFNNSQIQLHGHGAALMLMIYSLVFGCIPRVLWYSHVFPVLRFTAGSSVLLAAINYVQFSLFKWISQKVKIMKMRGPSRATMFFSITIH